MRKIPAIFFASLICTVSAAAMPRAAHAESRSYVVNWFHVATYRQDDDCPTGLNLAQRPLYVRILNELGYSGSDIEKILDGIPDDGGTDARGRQAREIGTYRGRIDGKEVDVYSHPYSVPDPNIKLAMGRYANGFNLDGKGPKSSESSIDPDTGEVGIDNQVRRAMGCSVQFHAKLPDRPGYPSNEWDLNRDTVPAWLMTITGTDLSADGDVTVTFDRTLEPIQRDANGGVLPDVTFRIDPDAHAHSEAKGRIENGVLRVTQPFTFRMTQEANVIADLKLEQTQLRLKFSPDRSVEGYIGGYQPWIQIYSQFATLASGTEISYGTDLPGLYYALRRLADFDPDPRTGENRSISATYRLEMVPAFAAPRDVTSASAQK
jgi:hypothetical protein